MNNAIIDKRSVYFLIVLTLFFGLAVFVKSTNTMIGWKTGVSVE